MRVRLPRFGTDWRCRWLVLPSWRALHRVAWIDWEDDDYIAGIGSTVCGHLGDLRMPGIFSRMGLPRCARCCAMVGIPRGNGHPWNEGIDA